MAAISVTAQTLIRFGLKQVGEISGKILAQPARFLAEVVFQPYVLTGIVIQGLGLILWLIILSRTRMGIAVALVSAFIVILSGLSSMAILKEPLKVHEWLGLGLVAGGVILLSLGGGS